MRNLINILDGSDVANTTTAGFNNFLCVVRGAISVSPYGLGIFCRWCKGYAIMKQGGWDRSCIVLRSNGGRRKGEELKERREVMGAKRCWKRREQRP